jgi:hypothetical protein
MGADILSRRIEADERAFLTLARGSRRAHDTKDRWRASFRALTLRPGTDRYPLAPVTMTVQPIFDQVAAAMYVDPIL